MFSLFFERGERYFAVAQNQSKLSFLPAHNWPPEMARDHSSRKRDDHELLTHDVDPLTNSVVVGAVSKNNKEIDS